MGKGCPEELSLSVWEKLEISFKRVQAFHSWADGLSRIDSTVRGTDRHSSATVGSRTGSFSACSRQQSSF